MAESFYGEARTEGGGLPKGWRKTTLGEICTFRAGNVFPKKYQGNSSGEIPFVKVSDMNLPNNERFFNESNNWISLSTQKEIKANTHPIGSIAFAKIGVALTFNRRRIIKIPTIIDNNMMSVIVSDEMVDSLFLYYLLLLVDFNRVVCGTALPYLNMGNLKKIEVHLPPLSEQRRIAEVLGSLDDKIELNRRMSQTLEMISQAIFKSWFVDFDPVIDNALAAGNEIPTALQARASRRASGDKLLPPAIQGLFPSEFESSAKGPIPKGWKIGLVGDLIVPTRGKTITKKQAVDGEVPVVAGGLEPAYFHNESNVSAPVVTISSSGANAGFVRLYHQDVWASDCSYISGGQSATPYLWYLFLKMNQGKIYHMQQGAVQPHVYPSDIMRLEMTYPEDGRLWRAIEAFVAVLFSKVRGEKEESETLSKLRDVLLPRLLSGTVSLRESGV